MSAITMVASRRRRGSVVCGGADLRTEAEAVNVLPLRRKYSAMMLAFHAPPEAVTRPVTRKGKMPGRMTVRQRCRLVKWRGGRLL